MKPLTTLLFLFQLSGLAAQSVESTVVATSPVDLSADVLKQQTMKIDSLLKAPRKTLRKWQDKADEITSSLDQPVHVPDSILNGTMNIDTLLQAKARLLQARIDKLEGSMHGVDSLKIPGLPDLNVADSLSSLMSKALPNDLPDLNKLNKAIDDLLPDLPEDKQFLAQQYNLDLDQLNGALESLDTGLDGEILNPDQLGRYSENLTDLQSQWTANSSLLEELKQVDLTGKPVDLALLEEQLGQLPALEALKSELPAAGDPLSAFAPPTAIPDHYKKLQDLQQQAKDWIQKSNIKPKQTLGEAKGQLDALKEKYINVPSSLDMGSAIRKNSLKQKPLKERLVIGGNMDFSLDPVSIEAAPTLGYRLNKVWQAGVATYWEHHFEEGTKKEETERYNVSGYTQYTFWKGALLHGEYRLMRHKAEETIDEELYWKGEGYGGIGKIISIKGRWQAQLLVLYNFSHDRHTPFTERWSTRWGVTRNLSFGKDKD